MQDSEHRVPDSGVPSPTLFLDLDSKLLLVVEPRRTRLFDVRSNILRAFRNRSIFDFLRGADCEDSGISPRFQVTD